ncbi:MAG: DNA (cytosine-5-)-methyltransferase [candidate division WOR-3 bacterium]
MPKIIHLDLFSGIGGFSLAVDAVWDKENVEHIFVDIDPFCRAITKKHWHNSIHYEDIREFIKQLTADTEKENFKNIFLLTGGFPCQPFSQAGRRKGTQDDRYLWREMFRVIQLTKPKWVVAENVRGLLTIEQGVVFQQVCSDLESEDYEVQSFIIPAVSVNAPHRRDRVWIIANRKSGKSWKQTKQKRRQDFSRTNSNVTNTNGKRLERNNSEGDRLCARCNRGERKEWNKNWIEVATELCRMDDGLPAELDGLKLSASRHRKERLKALGNAIVPQVAIEIMKAIKYAENN